MSRAKIFLTCVFLASFLLNIILFKIYSGKTPNTNSSNFETLSKKYPHLSQKILTDYNRDILINFTPLRQKLNDLVDKNYGSDFTMYFEYIPSGVSIAVNGDTKFYSASLLKVPIVMAYYKNREKNNSKDDQELTIKEKDIDKNYGSLWQKGAGSKVLASEAIRLALEESDNTAINVIYDQITNEDISKIYAGLDLVLQSENKQVVITAKGYSSVLKSLFFSSTLSLEDSEYILNLLSNSPFNDKLAAGVNDSVAIAHKIGTYEDKEKTQIFSDCGIVYAPNRPYILCMASRSDEATAAERMKTVSKTVFDFVSNLPDAP